MLGVPDIVGTVLMTAAELELDELELDALEAALELDELDELETELELELDELELDELEDVLLLLTVMLKAGSERLLLPSLTLMTIFE